MKNPVKSLPQNLLRLVLFLLFLLGVFFLSFSFSLTQRLPKRLDNKVSQLENPSAGGASLPAPSPTLIPTPTINWTSVHVPGQNDKPDQVGVAVPTAVNEAVAGGKAKIRSFEITGSNGRLSVNKIIVYEKDTLAVRFSSLDKPYDLFFPDFGVKQKLASHETKYLDFQAVASGAFPFFCSLCQERTSRFEADYDKGFLLVKPRS